MKSKRKKTRKNLTYKHDLDGFRISINIYNTNNNANQGSSAGVKQKATQGGQNSSGKKGKNANQGGQITGKKGQNANQDGITVKKKRIKRRRKINKDKPLR
ncbi:hypothetical protein [Alteribacillus sp. HJP-4]|uniref:hypothetical protein n=1 Tax=Alteribacillus sp. HJP-4 TaxID=2775394 RepID=UPI0035CCFA16